MTKKEESPFLKIGIILATLKASGNMPVVIIWFIIIVRDLLMLHLITFNNLYAIDDSENFANDV